MAQFPPDPKIPYLWVQDSGGNETLHRNGPGLSFAESFLGSIVLTGTEWSYKTRAGVLVKAGSYHKAKQLLIQEVSK